MQFLKNALYVSTIALSGFSSADDVYISIGTDGYQSILQHPSMAKLVSVQSTQAAVSNAGITILRVDENNLSAISEIMHHHHNRCGGFMVHDSLADAHQDIISGQINAAAIENLASYSLSNAAVVGDLQNAVSESGIRSVIESLAGFTNRYYTTSHGVDASNWLKNTWSDLAEGRDDIQVEQINHSWAQPSVMMTITGRTLPDEYVILGAHLDSIVSGGMTTNKLAPGADDDASGIATLTEVIAAITSTGFKPNKSVLLIGYAAEEVGLRGSNDIASQFKSQNKNVTGVLQLDMTNYQGSNGDLYLIDDYTNASQNNFIEQLARTYQPELTVGRSTCGYACSDHASWTNKGFIASFPFEATFNGSNPYIHSARDTIAQSGNNAYHALKFAKLAVAYVAELAKGNMTDTPDPDPVPEPSNEITETFNASLSANEESNFGPFAVAADSTVSLLLSGTNDADLYVKSGSAPTTRSFDCRPYTSSSNESCTMNTGSNTESIYVMVRGYSSSESSIQLTVTYTPASTDLAAAMP